MTGNGRLKKKKVCLNLINGNISDGNWFQLIPRADGDLQDANLEVFLAVKMYKSGHRAVRKLSKNNNKRSEKVGGKVMKWFPTTTVFLKSETLDKHIS